MEASSCASPDCALVDKATHSTEETALKRKRETAPAILYGEESDDDTVANTSGKASGAKHIATPTKNQGIASTF
ncbi:e5dcf1cc-0dd7-49a9-8d17-6f5720521bdc [Thermothielavioides terrestris]|uniref:E5dcf1cc-0dd7-49a9-8d17-6f5720521bdc n=1 Tax=Thermothielavioides terrestris TaxID=2587410 RepID=A0A3S4F046_9PEZI|nr:e5dcf1cc-0dd7-49a9-8d17-6f5720521bdc [Thermothielavioides terrestris]